MSVFLSLESSPEPKKVLVVPGHKGGASVGDSSLHITTFQEGHLYEEGWFSLSVCIQYQETLC